ncbi:MAG: hypothetical protein KJ645_00975 [Planctomycetes bacterium]|nr:hypothetical protein [Planctomycetota bacterium]
MNRFCACVIFLFILSFCACSEGWQRLEVEDLSYNDVFRLTTHVIDTNGFIIDEANTHTGEIVTRWNYGKFVEHGRFPIRRRVEAQIDPTGDQTYLIRLRAPQEALWEGLAAVELDRQEGWEDHGFDKNTTLMILSKIRFFVKEFKPSDDFYNRYKRKDRLDQEVPDVLDFE